MAQLAVRLQPRSSQQKIEVTDGVWKAWVSAPPVDGQANAAIQELLAKTLDVPKSRVSLVRGHQSRDKVFEIEGLSEVEIDEIARKLESK